MTDYSRLPREELIKEIEAWKSRAVDTQLIFVEDLQVYVDKELEECMAEFNRMYWDYHKAREAYYAAVREYEYRQRNRSPSAQYEAPPVSVVDNIRPVNFSVDIKKLVRKFLGGKND